MRQQRPIPTGSRRLYSRSLKHGHETLCRTGIVMSCLVRLHTAPKRFSRVAIICASRLPSRSWDSSSRCIF